MSDELVLSVYGSHNAAISMYYKGRYYVVEVERWTGVKNVGLAYYLSSRNYQQVFDDICEWLLSHTDGEDVDVFLTGYADIIRPKFTYKNKISYDHHTAHASTAFYQSPYDEMLVFTFDGGGDGAFFNVYTASRKTGISLVSSYKYDLGFPYMVLADTLSDIKQENLSIGNLVYAGKLMGLCAYGTVREDWLPHFQRFYEKFYYDGESYIGGAQIMKDAMVELFSQIGLDFTYQKTRFTGKDAWDIAATSQKAFEEQFFKIAGKYLKQYPDMPVGMSGGCALNVLLNTRLAKMREGKVYVPPNTNDCGMAVGGILWYKNPAEQIDLTYSGLPVLDSTLLHSYVNDMSLHLYDRVSVRELAAYISEGKIVGVIQGNSEHGSRALGNRSILCSPVDGMKDTINHKVKNREWYRPFAPVVRLEDVDKYFDFKYESRHMTYAADVRPEYRDSIPAVTHEDGTGRLQTVTRTQNELLYDVITEFHNITGNAVLLNTSFNVNGKPILTTLKDAFHLLNTTQLDAVFYNNRLIVKNGGDAAFESLRASGTYNVQPIRTRSSQKQIIVIGMYQKPSEVVSMVGSLRTDDTPISVMVLDEEQEQLIKLDSSLKLLPITPGHFYHAGRMQSMSHQQMADRLKLLWIRELVKGKPSNTNLCVVESFDAYNTSKYIKDARTKSGATGQPVAIGSSGTSIGVICGSVEDFIAIGNMAECKLLAELNSEGLPSTDSSNIEDYIAQYNNKFN